MRYYGNDPLISGRFGVPLKVSTQSDDAMPYFTPSQRPKLKVV